MSEEQGSTAVVVVAPIIAAADWAQRIRVSIAKTVQAIIETGRLLEAARDDLRGQFLRMLSEDLRISPDTAQQYMRVAGDPVLTDAANWRHLPASRSALDALAHLDDGLKLAAIADGRIHRGMTAADVRRIRSSAPRAERPWALGEAIAVLDQALYRATEGCPREDFDQALSDLSDNFAQTVRTLRLAYGGPLTPDELAMLLSHRERLAAAKPSLRYLRLRDQSDREIRAIERLRDGQAAGWQGASLIIAVRNALATLPYREAARAGRAERARW